MPLSPMRAPPYAPPTILPSPLTRREQNWKISNTIPTTSIGKQTLPLPFLHTLLPEAASDYELAATYSVFQEPESSIALRGNKLYWAVTAQGTNIPYYVNSAPLWKGRWITILRDHLPACFPSETFPSWLHPYLDLVEARMYDDIARRLQQEYSRNYVLRGVAVLPPALAPGT